MIPEPAVVEEDYTIPERSGETLFVPPAERLASLVTRYEPDADAPVLGVPLREFRRQTRERVRGLVETRAQRAGRRPAGDAVHIPTEWRSSGTVDRPLVLIGHQPVFFHPGVWVKYFLLTKLCAATGAPGLHCVVDTDATGPVTAPIPTSGDGGTLRPSGGQSPASGDGTVPPSGGQSPAPGDVGRTTRTLVSLPADLPLESAPVPGADAWSAFAASVRDDLAALGVPDLADRFRAFAEGEPAARRGASSLADYLDHLRRAYEARAGALRYADVNVSALAATPEFQAFALHLLQEPRALRHAHNGALDAYRRTHRIRSAANPFPNLVEADGKFETPFWTLVRGRRVDLFAAREGARVVLGTAEGPLASIPSGPGGVAAIAAAGVALRPKALTLTMFARLCLGDLFIHGIGGGRYDRVTDAVTRELFGVPPAPYAVATATLHLPLSRGGDPEAERRGLERQLMDLRHNPDRHLRAAGEAEQQLIDEKWAVIRSVEAMRPGRERREATRRIRELNSRLAERLAPEIARIEADLGALHAKRAAEDVEEFREYPFFLFDPGDVAALVPDLRSR